MNKDRCTNKDAQKDTQEVGYKNSHGNVTVFALSQAL